MSTLNLTDVACPDCGYDGPHSLFPAEDDSEPTIAECGDGDCGIEWTYAPARGPMVPIGHDPDVLMHFGRQHRVVTVRRWANGHGVKLTDWASACGISDMQTGHGHFDGRSSLLRKAKCRTCFP